MSGDQPLVGRTCAALPASQTMALGRIPKMAAFILLLLLAQVVTIAAVGTKGRGPLIADSLLLAIALGTAAACYRTGERSVRPARQFWQLMGSAFALWALGQMIAIYYDDFLKLPDTTPISEVLLFILSVAPIFIAVFGVGEGEDGIHWEWILDAVQVLTLFVAIYLLLIYVPSLVRGDAAVWSLQLRVLHWRNILLVAALAGRVLVDRSPVIRRLFTPVAAAMGLFTVATWFANHAQSFEGVPAGAWYDLSWSVPFTMIALAAVLWKDRPEQLVDTPKPARISPVLAVYLSSLSLPLLLLSMYGEVVKEQVIIGLSAMMFSVILYSLRLAAMLHRQRVTLDALRKSERRYRSLFDRNLAGVFRSTVSGRFLDCNERFCEIFGYTREEMVHQLASKLYPGGSEVRDRLLREREQQGAKESFEMCYQRKDGKEVWVIENLSRIRDETGEEILEGTMLDITERRSLEQQLRQAQKMEAIGRLAGGIAHDFNNLLTVISGYSELQSASTSPGDPVHHQATQIKGAADRAAGLTRQLLAFSRQQVLQPQLVNLNVILERFDKMLRRLLGEDIEVRLCSARDVGTVKVDPSQMDQVLLNLAVNARDAMPQGGIITIETSNVDLDSEYAAAHPYVTPGAYVLLAVSDTGSGMSAETRARIFEPFFTTKGLGQGTGLGLSTVYGIVKQSGGHIEVYSEEQRGSTFKVYLPRVERPADVTARPAVAAPREHGSETVLLAEDDHQLRQMANDVLATRGYKVLAAASSEEAEAVALKYQGSIDLLLTDVVMPGSSGPVIAKRIAQHRPGIKVLYMSGYTTNAIVHHGVLDEGISFLEKPFTPTSLAAKVRETLDQRA